MLLLDVRRSTFAALVEIACVWSDAAACCLLPAAWFMTHGHGAIGSAVGIIIVVIVVDVVHQTLLQNALQFIVGVSRCCYHYLQSNQ